MARMTLDDLVAQLRKAFGDELRAVVLYGSAAAGDHVAKKSDYNILIVVDALSAQRLQRASGTARAWGDAGNPAPLLLTSQEWRGSADIFPMEYADILAAHRVLHGTLDTDIRVDPQHLRLELEHEAMGALLQLRRGLLAFGTDAREQLGLLEAASGTMMAIFRAVLRLRGGEDAPRDNAVLAEQVGAAAGLDAAPFVRMVRHKRGEEKLRAADAPEVLSGYLAGLRQLVSYLDAFQGSR